MYPIRRQALDLLRARRMPPLGPGEIHVNRMRAWPWDIDPFGDLNNGRIVTLSDVGRISLALRSGLVAAMKRRRWGLAMAGSAPQYRKRTTMWARLEWRSRVIGRDEKFTFIDHVMIANGAPAAQVTCRLVVTSKGRLVPTQDVFDELGHGDWNPDLPRWVADWAAADDARPWPPEAA